MRWMIAVALAVMAFGSTAIADEKAPVPGHNGLTIGHDGKMWRMEGCAAYPVDAKAGGQSKPVAAATPAITPGKTPAVAAALTPTAEEKLARTVTPAE